MQSPSPEEFAAQWKARHQNELRLSECRIHGKQGLWEVYIIGGRIAEVVPHRSDSDTGSTVRIIPCGGRHLLPGLCDAHCHVTAHTADLNAMLSVPESLTTVHATQILRAMLQRGFTTVRDCGGADWGLAQAIEDGMVIGPRLLFTGHALSQTGGHGDMRKKGEDCFACGAALRGIGRVCDGDAQVRAAARDELRKGAHCIKVMASGGVSSPTDRLTNTQFSMQELKAIVEEAKAANTYVCAHAYTSEAISRAIDAGVRSIEHGNYLDEHTAKKMAAAGAFLVPTIVTYKALIYGGQAAGMPQELVDKVGDLVDAGLRSLDVAMAAGVSICFGSDLLGDLQERQLEEFLICGQQMPSTSVIESATVNCASLFNMEDSIGRIKPGYLADLILVDAEVSPYKDSSVLANEHAICLVIKEGVVAKCTIK